MSILISILILSISPFSAFAEEGQTQMPLVGSFTVLGQESQAFNYSNCQAGREIVVREDADGLVVTGLLDEDELEFPRINQKPTGHPAPVLNYQQRRTFTEEAGEGRFKVTKQVRWCVGLLGAVGCIGRTWRTTAWLEYIPYGDNQTLLLIGYQPFTQSPVEVCPLGQK